MKTPAYGESLTISGKRVKWVLEGVPAGEYAVSLVHDENGDGSLDTGLMGIPTESYGFSNDAEAMFGPASWADSKFTHGPGDTRIAIELAD